MLAPFPTLLLLLTASARAQDATPPGEAAPAPPQPAAPAEATDDASAPLRAVEGRVIDVSTGGPLPGAVVRGPRGAVTSDVRGRFTLVMAPGDPVTFTAPGFPEVTLPAPDGDDWRVRLAPEAEALEVVVEARRDDPVVSVTTLDRERVLETPGTFEDPVRLVQSLPGVAVTPEYSPAAGDLAIRGAAPGETRFALDRIDLPYLYHYNGYSSVLHTRLLDELALYPSTFGADWGNATGGVVDARTRWDVPEAVRGSVNLNLVMGGAEVAVPIGDTWAVRAGGRRSYLDALEREDEQYTVFPKFWDYFARAELHPGAGRAYGLMAFGAGDSYTRYSGEPTELAGWEQESNPKLEYAQRYHVAALQQRDVLGRTRMDGVLAYLDYTLDGALPTASELRLSRTLQLREDVTVAASDSISVATGVDVKGGSYTVAVATDRMWPEVAEEAPLLGRGAAADIEALRLVGGAYAELRAELGTVRVVPGARLDGDSLTGAVAPSPRLSLRWQAGPDTRVRAAAGGYTQFPTVDQLDAVIGAYPAAGAPPMRAWQAAVGVDHAIAGRLEVGLDGWAKTMSDLVIEELDGSLRGGVDGVAWGVEAVSRYRLREVFFASLSVAGGRATRDGQTFDFDQPWAANLVSSWNFAPTWNTGLRLRAAAGLPYTPVTDGVYMGATDSYAPVYGARNSVRTPVYTKVDYRVEKTWTTRHAKVAAYSELWWVPSGSNVMYQAYRYDYDDVAPVVGPPFIPLVGLRVESR